MNFFFMPRIMRDTKCRVGGKTYFFIRVSDSEFHCEHEYLGLYPSKWCHEKLQKNVYPHFQTFTDFFMEISRLFSTQNRSQNTSVHTSEGPALWDTSCEVFVKNCGLDFSESRLLFWENSFRKWFSHWFLWRFFSKQNRIQYMSVAS